MAAQGREGEAVKINKRDVALRSTDAVEQSAER
jgi:hypothetical protein